jgi:hypothetical protein
MKANFPVYNLFCMIPNFTNMLGQTSSSLILAKTRMQGKKGQME